MSNWFAKGVASFMWVMFVVLMVFNTSGCGLFTSVTPKVNDKGEQLYTPDEGKTETTFKYRNPQTGQFTNAPYHNPVTGQDAEMPLNKDGTPNQPNTMLAPLEVVKPAPWIETGQSVLGGFGPWGALASMVLGGIGTVAVGIRTGKLGNQKAALFAKIAACFARIIQDWREGKIDANKDGKLTSEEIRDYAIKVAKEFLLDLEIVAKIVDLAQGNPTASEADNAIKAIVASV